MAMGDIMKQFLAKTIQLADQVTKSVDDAQTFKQECLELKSKTIKLAALLYQASRYSSDLYEHERPPRRIMEEIKQVLLKALSLVRKFRANSLIKRLFTTVIIPATAFKKISAQIEKSIEDVSGLLRISDDQNEPIHCLIGEQIDTLCKASSLDEDRSSDAAASLVSLARDNDRYRKLIIQEGGVGPLLKLLKEGRMEGQESAARAIGLLGCDPESVQHMIHAGVCDVFEKILEDDGPVKVQSMVAWAVSELVANHPKCQVHFAQTNIIRFLVTHLADHETVHREYDDQASMMAMVAKALWHLAKGNSAICRSITESGGLLCFVAVLEEQGPYDEVVKYNSAMALMEIAAVAEEDTELRSSAFEPNTPAAKAVFDQLLRIIEQEDSDLLIPCIMTMGYLARTFGATETRIIGPLIKLLEDQKVGVSNAAAIALSKFACTHLNHSKAIINEGGVKHLIQNVYFGEQIVGISALIVLSYIALHVPDSEELAQEEVLTVFEWASKQDWLIKDPTVHTLLSEAKSRLELYKSRGTRRFH